MELVIDASELLELARRSERASQVVQHELSVAGRASGLAIQRYAQSEIPVGVGTAKAQTTMKSVDVTPAGVTITVVSSAQSAAGYPYPWVLEEGTRGDIVPVRAKVLAFESGGKKVFTKRVKRRHGTHFMANALKSATAFIYRQFEDATRRAAEKIMGG